MNINITRNILVVFALISLSLVLSACGNDNKSYEETIEIKREKLKLEIEDMSYNKEESKVVAKVSSNLPKGIEVSAYLDFPSIADEPYTMATIGEDENLDLVFSINERSKEDFVSGDYGIRFYVDVDGDDVNNPPNESINDNQNERLLYDSRVGGYSDDLYSEYEDSETVDIVRNLEDDPYDEEDYNNRRYSITLRSVNTYSLQTDFKTDEELQSKVKEDQLTPDFFDYNKKYYQSYKNSMDLISSNFELISEGEYSPALIDDLITWTNEFNELLDVYEADAIPVTNADKKLKSITEEMITNQREANNYILQGLKNSDNESLINAASYLETVVSLYAEGYELL
jgi:hypothetical protein